MNQLHVIFKLAGAEYAIAADEVVQMESFNPAAATPVPGTPDYLLGLVQLRQQTVPVIHSRLRLGLPFEAATLDSRLIVIRKNHRLVGLLVDSAREVIRISEAAFAEGMGVLESYGGGFVKAVARTENRTLLLIDTSKILGEEATRG